MVLVSTADAARIYRVPARTIRRWYTEGRITEPVRHQGRLFWDAEQIAQLVRLRGVSRLRKSPVMADTLSNAS
jgi:predicted site-specific integrase-resolvase